MKIHDLKPAAGSHKRAKRVGRGIAGKGGKTAGRGTKGQRARGTVPVGFEGGQLPLFMRVPKLRGFNNPFRVEYQAINLDTIEASGLEEVTPETLLAKGLVSKGSLVKVLGRGELTRAVTVKAHACSKSAQAAIVDAGGSFEAVPLPFEVRPSFSGSAHTNR
jgi:large subunit ribosomal protein L15